MDALYLTPDELAEQTGLIQGAAQIRALQADGFVKGIHFFIRADGKPRVLRSALVERQRPELAQPVVKQPNFGALRATR
jgi:hypothetical protein